MMVGGVTSSSRPTSSGGVADADGVSRYGGRGHPLGEPYLDDLDRLKLRGVGWRYEVGDRRRRGVVHQADGQDVASPVTVDVGSVKVWMTVAVTRSTDLKLLPESAYT